MEYTYAYDFILVLFCAPPGWWLIQYRGKSGWVPAAYLQKYSKLENGDEVADEDSSNYLGFVVEEGERQ